MKKELQKIVKDYIMDNTVRKERFTDIEICCEADNYEANEVLDKLVDEYTIQDCFDFIHAMEIGRDICYGGFC